MYYYIVEVIKYTEGPCIICLVRSHFLKIKLIFIFGLNSFLNGYSFFQLGLGETGSKLQP